MAKYRVDGVEERVNGRLVCDTRVLIEVDDGEGGLMDKEIGHFDVVLSAAQVLAVKDLPKSERVAAYKVLFGSDPRIAGVVDSEAAATQMSADVTFPVTVDL